MTDALFEFNKESHGSTNYYRDEVYIKGDDSYCPLSFLQKKNDRLSDIKEILQFGLVQDDLDFLEDENFYHWYEKQFSRKLARAKAKKISIVYLPDSKAIISAIENVFQSYEVLRAQHILLNGKNLPVQLGEWYAKSIFGLHQVKSTSQRGFDFLYEGEKTEVKVSWSDTSSPKGLRLRKSLVDLSTYCILIYIARNFMIREICFLDSDFILRKFSGKGHSIFLKDADLSSYFFGRSNKQFHRIVNRTALMKYANPTFALKLAENLQ